VVDTNAIVPAHHSNALVPAQQGALAKPSSAGLHPPTDFSVVGAFGNAGQSDLRGAAATGGDFSSSLAHIEEGMATLKSEQERLHATVRQQLADNRQYMEERDQWIEHQFNLLSTRCEKVEGGTEKVLNHLHNGQFELIGDHLTNISDFMQSLTRERARASVNRMQDGENSEESDGSKNTAGAKPSRGIRYGKKKLDERMDELTEKVSRLEQFAEENAEQRKLLWKIDLNLRQLRQSQVEQQNRRVPSQTPTRGNSRGSRQRSKSGISEDDGASPGARSSGARNSKGSGHSGSPKEASTNLRSLTKDFDK